MVQNTETSPIDLGKLVVTQTPEENYLLMPVLKNCQRSMIIIITCLPMMWKILTVQIREEIYYLLTSHGLFPDEQKGCRKGSRGTAELLTQINTF